MSTQLIKTLINNLPRFSEEQGDFYTVTRKQLIKTLCQKGTDKIVAENTVTICQLLLDSLACLNTDYLARGEWCFVSFPAQLMALSVLESLIDPGSRFFEARKNEAHFWNTHGISNEQKEFQLNVLKEVETRRHKLHSDNDAKPIRFIYVAWSLIKVDDKILFYQREDTKKRYDKQSGDYGLVGGRVNQYDLKFIIENMDERLRALQSPNPEKIRPAFENTLKRELAEEVGLIYEYHYTFKLWRELKPYQQVQGAAPNHALTEYFLNIYSIKLTLEGFCFLHKKIIQDDRLVWFTLDDMAKGETSDGKIAYIRALFDDFDDNRGKLKQALTELPNGFQADYAFDQENYAFILAKDSSSHFYQGRAGKEKPFNLNLNPGQLSLLLGLAAHQRGFQLSYQHEDITALHPYGWIEVKSHSALSCKLNILAEKLKDNQLAIEAYKGFYFRLPISPDSLFFDYDFYTWDVDLEIKEDNFSIYRSEIITRLGVVPSKVGQLSITPNLASNLKKIATNQLNSDEKSMIDSYRNSACPSLEGLMGMSRLLKMDNGSVKCLSKLMPTELL